MNIVTVTWYDDLRQIILQAESMERFLTTPVVHYVVINNYHPNMKRWDQILTPYYNRHTLKLIKPPADVLVKGHSYLNQQTLKFWIGTIINDDYMLLDSKNFWIKETSMHEYQNFKHSAGTWNCDVDNYCTGYVSYAPFVELFCKKYNLKKLQKIPGISTPYIFSKKIIDKAGGFDTVTMWFLDLYKTKNMTDISEFLFYGHLVPPHEIDEIDQLCHVNYTIWSNEEHPFEILTNYFFENPHIKSISLHWRWLLKHKSDIDTINNWLSSIGLTTKLKTSHSNRWI